MESVAAGLADREARRKLKKQRKLAAKGHLAHASGALPSLESLYGPDSSPAFELKMEKARRSIDCISTEDAQNLLLWLFTQATSPQWVFVRNKALISGVVLLVLREASSSQLVSAAPSMPFVRGLSQVKTTMPRGSHWNKHRRELRGVDAALLYTSESSNSKKKRAEGGGSGAGTTEAASVSASAADKDGEAEAPSTPLAQRTPHQHALAVHRMCLRLSEWTGNNFPSAAPARDDSSSSSSSDAALLLPPRHVMTRTAAEDLAAVYGLPSPSSPAAGTSGGDASPAAPARPRLLAVDCEMCQTAVGLQLARVTVIDEDESTALDVVVRPELPVMDHLTQYSGITPAMLASATATISEVQAQLLELIDGSGSHAGRGPAVLVGHSVECDLQALRLVHTRVIDSSLAFPHPAGLPYRHALRHLARTRLGRTIQAGHGTTGHDSHEDTLAALHLVQAALEEAPLDASDGASDDEDERGTGATVSATGGEPPAKRAKIGTDAAAAAAAASAVVSSGVAAAAGGGRQTPSFIHHFRKAGREHMIPPPPAPQAAAAAAASSGAASTTASIRGVSATMARLVQGPGGGSGGRSSARSLLLHPGLGDKSVCGGTSLVGSPAFLRGHLCGPASGVSVPVSPSLADLRRCLEKTSVEATRAARARREAASTPSSYVGPGLVVAEAIAPELPASSGGGKDWAGLDAALSSWSASLPRGTAVMVVSQAKLEAVGAAPAQEGSDGGVPAAEAAWGSTLMWVCPVPPRSGAAGAGAAVTPATTDVAGNSDS